MSGILYVVATPIGNLEDVTLRALRVLREVTLIAAEDTRRTARLLQHYSISTPTTSLHEHNEQTKGPSLVSRLIQGAAIALVSDAGTPAISDPGARFVRLAREAGVRIDPVPGPNAAIAALSVSGFTAQEFAFVGFPPARSSARIRWLERLRNEQRLLVFYEAPHRIGETLRDMHAIFGDRLLALGRELTKAHEELVVRPISTHLAAGVDRRGEYTLVLDLPRTPASTDREVPTALTLSVEFGELTNNRGLDRRAAIKELAAKYALSSRDVYKIVEDAKK